MPWGENDTEVATLDEPAQPAAPAFRKGPDLELSPHDIWKDPDAPSELRQAAANAVRWKAVADPEAGTVHTASLGELMTVPKMLPFAGHITTAIINTQRKLAQDRIKAGKGTEDDYWTVAGVYEDAMLSQRHAQSQARLPGYVPDPENVGKTASFMAELYGLAPATKAISALAGEGIAGTAAGIATEAVGTGLAPEAISQRYAPYIDKSGRTQSGQDVPTAALSGFTDAMIEMGVERAGEHFGKLLPKPVRDRAARLWQKYIGLYPRGTSAEFAQIMRDTHFDGLLGEVGEERLGEILTGAKDVAMGDPRADFGATGDIAAGLAGDRQRLGQGLRQVGQEVATFGPLAAAGGAVNAAAGREAYRNMSGQEASAALGVNPELNPTASASAFWQRPEVAKPAVEQMIAAGKTPDEIRELATNPSNAKWEEFGLGTRADKTVPNTDARRAFGENAIKYLDSLTQQETQTPVSPEQKPQESDVSTAKQETLPGQASTPGFDLNLKTPPTGQQSQTNVASPAAPLTQADLLGQPIVQPNQPKTDFGTTGGKQETLFGKEGLPGQQNLFPDKGVPDDMVQKQNRENVPPDPIEQGSKDWRKIVEYQAGKWGMDPDTYKTFADQVWRDETERLTDREEAKAEARKALGKNASHLSMLENKGKDFTSIKGFDVVAERLANNYPSLGWQHLVGQSSSELEQKLWDLMREGKQKIPNKFSRPFHDKIEAYLNHLEQETSFNPSEFEGEHGEHDHAFRMADTSQPGERDQMSRMSPQAPHVAMKMEGTGGPSISAQGIVATLAKMFNIPIRSGRVQVRKALGIYDKKQEVIRTKGQSSADLAVITHEVAHHIDFPNNVRKGIDSTMRSELKNLDYDPKQKRAFEGFAEFVRMYMTEQEGLAQEKAPKFFDHFTQNWLPKHPAIQAKFEKARQLVRQYLEQGAVARAEAGISDSGKPAGDLRSVGERLPEIIGTYWDRTIAAWKDKGHAINLMDQAAKNAGYQLKPGESYAGELYQAFDQSGIPHAERALEDGVHLVTQTGEKIGEGMRKVLTDIQPADYPEFRRFLWARHAQEVHTKKPLMNPGITPEDANFIVDAVKEDPQKLARYTKAAEGVTKFNHNLLDMLVDAGVITPGSAHLMKKQWETYIPLFRATEKGGGRFGGNLIDLPDPIRRRRGSGRQILDPIESTMQQAIAFYNVAIKKQVQLQMIKQADPSLGGARGMAGWVESVTPNMKQQRVDLGDVWKAVVERLNELGMADVSMDPETLGQLGEDFAQDYLNIYRPDYSPSPKERVIRVVHEGQPRLYQLDPDLYNALDTMAPFQVPAFVRVFDQVAQGLASTTRLGATGLSTGFAGANLVRDWFTYQIQSEHAKGAQSITDPFRWIGAYVASKTMSTLADSVPHDTISLWEEGGGQLAASLGQDRKSLRKYRDQLVAHSTKQHVRELLVHPINSLRDIVGVAEVGPRLAEFSNVLAEHGFVNEKGKLIDKATGERARPPRDVLVKAINAANDVTVNFKRMGSVGRVVNRYIPFFNAALEGNAKRIRVLKQALTGGTGWKRKVVAMTSLAAASLMYALMRGKDDDYKEEEAWLKNSYWTFTDGHGNPVLRIPKPYEFSFIPNFVEALVGSIREGNPSPAKETAEQEFNRLMPPFVPQVVRPATESYFNWDFFRQKAIENDTLAKLKPGDRSYPYTTELMKRAGQYSGVSPARLEHFVNESSGGLYDKVERPIEHLGSGQVETSDLPVINAFTIRKDYAKSIDEFYARKTELEQSVASAKAKGEEPTDAPELAKFTKYADAMKKLRKSIAGVQGREDRFAAEKYIIGLARAALGKEPLARYPTPAQ
jgi:hypothetical protein